MGKRWKNTNEDEGMGNHSNQTKSNSEYKQAEKKKST